MADQRRLSGTGKAHDAEDLAARDLEGRVLNADDAGKSLQNFRFADAFGLHRGHRFLRAVAEDLPNALQVYDDLVHAAVSFPGR